MRTSISEFSNASTQTLLANGNIAFNDNTYPADIYQYNSNGSISFLVPGIYEVLGNFVVLATAEGDVTISMEQAGSAAPGGTASASLAAIGDYATLPIANIVKVRPSRGTTLATINFEVSTATSIAGAEVIIKRVG